MIISLKMGDIVESLVPPHAPLPHILRVTKIVLNLKVWVILFCKLYPQGVELIRFPLLFILQKRKKIQPYLCYYESNLHQTKSK